MNILKRWRARRDSEITPAIRPASERKLEASIRRFKALEYAAAAVVVVGIGKESFGLFMWLLDRSGLWSALWAIWGGVAVVIGVSVETLCSMAVSSREGKLHSIEAQKRVEAEAKTAEALREVANANLLLEQERLARVKIEQRMRLRFLTAVDQENLRVLLTSHPLPSYPRMSVDVIVFDHHMREPQFLAGQITSLFNSINWVVRQWDSGKVTRRIEGSSVLVALAVEHVNAELVELADKFARSLTELGIDCSVEPGSFGCTGELTGFGFELRFEKYPVVTGHRGVAPFRIQIGAKQLVAFPPHQVAWVSKA